MKQVKRHNLKCHCGKRTGKRSSLSMLDQNEWYILLNEYLRKHTDTIMSPLSEFGIEADQGGNILDESAADIPCNSMDIEFPALHFPALAGDEVLDAEDTDLHYNLPGTITENTTKQFRRYLVHGNAVLAASVLVTRAAFQSPNPSATPLPHQNIMHFLYLAKLVLSTGCQQLSNLSKDISILYPYVDNAEKGWAPMPCTVSGFRSRFLNVSNKNSLVSILPIPRPEELPDGHGYTPFCNILSHALMMKTFDEIATKDPKWQSIASSKKFMEFLHTIPFSEQELRQLAIGILFWTDGWDTSTGCKSNRSPMHTGTITLLFVDVETHQVVGTDTYPNMGGPGKIDHGHVSRRFQEDIEAYESADSVRIFLSRHHSGKVECYTQIMFIVQDQPERRQASCLLGGGSTLHPMFGLSCDFLNLVLPFSACQHCQKHVIDYLGAKDWSKPPLINSCEHYLG
jgi:hypothetical protein